MPTAITSVFRTDGVGRFSLRTVRRAVLAAYGRGRRLRDRFERRLAALVES